MPNSVRSTLKYVGVMAILLSCSRFVDAAGIPKPESQAVSGNISWVYDYEQAQRVSEETGKPMFVVFRCER